MTLAKIILQNLIKISSKIYALDSGYNTNSGVLSRFMPACFKTLFTQQQVEKQRQKGNNPFDLIRQRLGSLKRGFKRPRTEGCIESKHH